MKKHSFVEKVDTLFHNDIGKIYLSIRDEIFANLYNSDFGEFGMSYNDLVAVVEGEGLPNSLLQFINQSTNNTSDLRCFVVDPIYNMEIYVIIGNDLSLSNRFDNKPDGLTFHYYEDVLNTPSDDQLEITTTRMIVDIIVVGMLSDGIKHRSDKKDRVHHVLKHEIVHCALNYLEDMKDVCIDKLSEDEEEFLCDFIPFYGNRDVTVNEINRSISAFMEKIDIFKPECRNKYKELITQLINHYT